MAVCAEMDGLMGDGHAWRVMGSFVWSFGAVCTWKYVVWWALSAQSECGLSVRTAGAAPVQKTRPEKLLRVPNGSLAAQKCSEPNVRDRARHQRARHARPA